MQYYVRFGVAFGIERTCSNGPRRTMEIGTEKKMSRILFAAFGNSSREWEHWRVDCKPEFPHMIKI